MIAQEMEIPLWPTSTIGEACEIGHLKTVLS